ncbi:hypothetical protein FJ251_06795 [bacterium]|nr:hypothetical protein [bacterium]
MSMKSLGALGAALLLSALPAAAAWEEAYDTGHWALCVVADPVHQIVYAGLYDGLAIYEAAADNWVSVHGSAGLDAVRDLLWHPKQPGLLILAYGIIDTPGRIDRSLDGGFTAETVYMLPEDVYIGDLERDPTEPDRFYAACYTFGSIGGGMVLRSEDAGLNWRIVEQSNAADRHCLAVDGAGQLYRGGPDGIWRSPDGGLSWVSAQGDLPAAHIMCLRAMPGRAPGHLFACTELDLYETLDSGQHWEPILWGEKCTDLVIHSTVPQLMAAHITLGLGPMDEVTLSTNAGQSWAWSGYWMVANDWGAYQGMDILPMQNRIFATMQDWIYTYDLGATGLAEVPSATPRAAAFPNPFNPATRIAATLPAARAVSLDIVDSAGRLQRRLLDDVPHPGGALAALWDGRDAAGRPLPSGVYHYRLRADGRELGGKLVLLR